MIIQKFQEQLDKFKDNIAVKDADRTITYAQLNNYANRVAEPILELFQNTLKRPGVVPTNLQHIQNDHDCVAENHCHSVALLFEHGADMIIAVFAALKASMTYIPMDVTYPWKRLKYMLDDSEANIILTNSTNSQTAIELVAKAQRKIMVLNINDYIDKNDGNSTSIEFNAGLDADENSIAYILYTSGSTGKPKGVFQTHRNILYYTRNWIHRFSITESDRLTLFSAFSHDGSIQDMFAALLSGATLYPYYIKTTASTNELYNLLMKEKITIWHSVPSLYRYFTGTLTEKNLFYDIRWVVLGGEPLRPHDVEIYSAFFPKANLANVYGQTESSVSTICVMSHGESFDNMSSGEPLDETKILLVDEDGDIIETMGIGEIVVASDYIAMGYWKDQENTKRVFTCDDEWGRLYWTGDLGRITMAGTIKIMGRKDSQVKIRGYRIEIGEIESVLLRHKAIKEAATVSKQNERRDNFLSTYFVSDDAIPIDDLRAFLAKELPDYMIPQYLVQLEKMPLTPNNKIDRQQLLELEEVVKPESIFVAPSNEIEKKLAIIWEDILDIDRVGINDDFIELGGHSLLVISIISRVLQEFNVELQLGDVFENPTIKKMAQLIMISSNSSISDIRPLEEKEYYPANTDQLRMFVLSQFEGISTSYNLPVVWKVDGNIDPVYFENILKKLIDRHDMFRTSFKMIADELVQVMHKNIDFSIEYIEAENLNSKNKNTIMEIIKSFIRPFDLSIAPLLRVALVKQTMNKHFLLLDSHHIITDGVSGSIYAKDFYSLYNGKELSLLKLKYRDYSEWQSQLEKTGQLDEQEKYWLDVFKGKISVLNFPTDFPRPALQSFLGDIVVFELSKDITNQFNQLVKETGTTLFMLLLAMFNILLYKYTGVEDIIIGTIIAGRNNIDLEKIIGFFAKTLALKNQLKPDKFFNSFLGEVKQNTLKSFENQMYPFSRLIEKLKLTEDRSRNPLFDVAFALQNIELSLSKKNKREDIDLKFIPHGFENNISLFDLYFQAIEDNDGILCCFQYNTKLFKRETIELMKERFLVLSENILNNKDAKIQELNWETGAERELKEIQEAEFEF